jgi:hypothetical protein
LRATAWSVEPAGNGGPAAVAGAVAAAAAVSYGYGYSGDELMMMAQSRPASLGSTAMREKRHALLMAVMQNVIEMHTTSTINLSEMREVMAGIRRRETEEMRYSFYTSSENNDRFRIKSEIATGRIQCWCASRIPRI